MMTIVYYLWFFYSTTPKIKPGLEDHSVLTCVVDDVMNGILSNTPRRSVFLALTVALVASVRPATSSHLLVHCRHQKMAGNHFPSDCLISVISITRGGGGTSKQGGYFPKVWGVYQSMYANFQNSLGSTFGPLRNAPKIMFKVECWTMGNNRMIIAVVELED